jgi:hypothetical protein
MAARSSLGLRKCGISGGPLSWTTTSKRQCDGRKSSNGYLEIQRRLVGNGKPAIWESGGPAHHRINAENGYFTGLSLIRESQLPRKLPRHLRPEKGPHAASN